MGSCFRYKFQVDPSFACLPQGTAVKSGQTEGEILFRNSSFLSSSFLSFLRRDLIPEFI